MQSLLLPVTDTETLNNAKQTILNRSPLYNKDKNELYIKYNDELNLIQTQVDNDNIVLNENNEATLADDVHCESLTIKPDNSDITYKANVLFAETTAERTIILLSKISDINGAISGNLYISGDTISGGYHFTVTSAGTRYLEGAISSDNVTYVQVTYNDEEYIGIKLPANTKVYFSGYDLRNESIIPPEYTTYTDNDYSKIDVLSQPDNIAASDSYLPITSAFYVNSSSGDYISPVDVSTDNIYCKAPVTSESSSEYILVNDFIQLLYEHSDSADFDDYLSYISLFVKVDDTYISIPYKLCGSIKVSPVEGTIIRRSVEEAASVHANDTIVVIDSHKMEIDIKAPIAGKIHFLVSPGDQISADGHIAEIYF